MTNRRISWAPGILFAGFLLGLLGLGFACSSDGSGTNRDPLPNTPEGGIAAGDANGLPGADGSTFGDGGAFPGTMFDGGAPEIDGLESVRIDPEEVTVRIEDGEPATQEFEAIGTFEDGSEKEITDEVRWSFGNTELGSVQGGELTANGTRGGVGVLRVVSKNASAAAKVTIRLEAHFTAEPPSSAAALPSDPEGLFDTTEEDARSPQLVYPNEGVVLPPNLGRLEIHWLKGDSGNTLFDIALTNEVTDIHLYTRCTKPSGIQDDGCILELSDDVWNTVAETNRGRPKPVKITVRATDDDGSSFGASKSRDARFALDDLNGTIYYWTVSGNGRIMRYDFGADRDSAEEVVGPQDTQDGDCVGCHALSPDGTKLVGSVGGQHGGGMLLFDLESGDALRNATGGDDHILQFADFAPSGDELVGVYGDDQSHSNYGDLVFFDTRCDGSNMSTCGQQVDTHDLGMNDLGNEREASHVDWSPDGERIVFTDVGHHETSQRPGYGALSYVERQQDGSWSSPNELLPRIEGKNRYNPHFAPNSEFLVFNESTCSGGSNYNRSCNADTDPSAKIFALPRDGGTPIQLDAAMAPGTMDEDADLANTFPRFAPFVFKLSKSEEFGTTKTMWLTFSSTRTYGLRTPMSSPGAESDRSTWLWMTAVRPGKIADGEDPSAPAFALPFQDLDTSNHIAVWTTQSVGDPDDIDVPVK